MSIEKEILMTMLSFDLTDTKSILTMFSELDGAVSHLDGEKNNFVYVPGSREDSVVLVAHTDTVWDSFYLKNGFWGNKYIVDNLVKDHKPKWENGRIHQGGSELFGLGADDRAGCAMLYLLKNSGHSLLITDGEEHGQIGANYLMTYYPDIAAELNAHQYMIQLDRQGSSDYKTYRLNITEEFCRFIETETGYTNAGQNSRTDIVTLCRRICGVNLSIGYYHEHTSQEYLVYEEWYKTYEIVKEMLKKPQPFFSLNELC